MLIRTIAWLLVFVLTMGQHATLLASDYFGQVTFNGLPVPGASVTATQGDTKASATSDGEGIYRLADLADGLWKLTIEVFGFDTITREIAIPTKDDPPPDALSVRSYDELTRALPPPRVFEPLDSEDEEPLNLTALTGIAGMGAADGLLINGSLNNGASTRFALPRGIGNNRPRPRGVYSYAAGFQMGSSAWDARPFSLIGSQSAKPSYADTQALFTFQGPLRVRWLRNPITLSLSYQGASTTNVTTQSTRMPTALERAGDFSQTLDARGQPARVIDPATGHPFEESAIPVGRISPQAAALLAYYPSASAAADGRFNYEAPVVSATRQDSVQSRAGYSLKGENRLEGGVSYQRGSGRSTSLFGFEDSRGSSGLTANGALTLRPKRNMTLSLRYQYSRSSNESLPYFANRVNVSGDAGINGNDQDPRNWGPPGLSFASDLAGLSSGSYALTRTTTQVWAADFSRFRGNHNVGLGIEARAIVNDVIGQQDPRGTFGFTGAVTGLDFADFLLGLPQTSTIGFGNPDKAFRGGSYAAFVNDEWKIRPNLTLTYGVRWEYETPITEAQGRLANLSVAPGFASVDVVTAAGKADPLVNADRTGLEPRLGIAWRPTLGSLVIRGGYGIYRNLNIYQSIATLLAAQPPFSTAFNIASSPLQPLTLADGFIPVNGTSNTFAIDPEFRAASAHTWQVSVQRELPAQLTMLATYLGTRGTNLMQQVLPNTYPAGADNPCPACPVGFRYLTSNGRSMRHSAQIQVRRRLSAGFTAATEYTFAKSMDDAASFGGATLGGGALVQNWRDPHAEYARSSFDQRHLLTASVDYTTGSGIRGGTLLDGMKGRLLKDWTMTARVSTGSGLPVTPVYFAPVSGTGIIGSLRPDLTGIAHDAPAGAYANREAFAAPAPGQWGKAPRNSITGPRTFSLDAAVARTFRVNNRLNMDWRIDATNVLNRVTYSGINALITSPQFGLPNRVNEMRKILYERQAAILMLLRLLLVIALCAPVVAAQQTAPEQPTFRASTKLIVTTVVVRNPDGTPVEGLTAADFVVTEDNEPQEIAFVEYQRLDNLAALPAMETLQVGNVPRPSSTAEVSSIVTPGITVPPSGDGRFRNRRLIILFFDLSNPYNAAQERMFTGATTYLDGQMTEADLVAILTYRGGAVRVKQDFTDDRRKLANVLDVLANGEDADGDGVLDFQDFSSAFGQNDGEFNVFTTDRKLAALQTAVAMLRPLPEQKSLVFFTDSLSVNGTDNNAQMRATTNAAIRANVQIFPVDARGLVAMAPLGNANQRSPGGIGMFTGALAQQQVARLQRSQDTFYALAKDTGGKALLDYNDLSLGIRQAAAAQSSYYMLAFYSTHTVNDGKFRRIQVRLKDSTRQVALTFRQGYYADKEWAKQNGVERERQIEEALMLENPITDITIALELNYFQVTRPEYFVPVSAKIPGSELELARRRGAKALTLDVLLEVKDSYGATQRNMRDRIEVSLSAANAERLITQPIQYDTGVTLLPGRYMMKLLVRDAEVGRIGTYQTTFTIPNLNREPTRLPISSVVLGSQRLTVNEALYNVKTTDKQSIGHPLIESGRKLLPSVTRVFSASRDMHVYLEAYEQYAEPMQPLIAYATFYREGAKVYESQPVTVTAGVQRTSKAIPIRMTIPLGSLSPGRYDWQVTVIDPTGRKAAFWQTAVAIVP